MSGNKNDRKSESDRILERIARETEGGASLITRAAKRARNHVSATDVDAEDRIELLGTRIGRALGLVFLVVLIVYLISLVLGG